MSQLVLDKLKEKFGSDVLETHDQFGDDTAVVAPRAWKAACEFLRGDPALDFNLFVDLCGVDYPERSPRFEVVLHVYSVSKRHRIRLKARVGDAEGDEAELDKIARRHVDLIALIEADGLTGEARDEIEELELLLHNSIIAILRNPLIETSYKRMHNYLRLVRLDRKLTAPLALRSLREHIEIITACQARDADKAEAALTAHFGEALRRHMGFF